MKSSKEFYESHPRLAKAGAAVVGGLALGGALYGGMAHEPQPPETPSAAVPFDERLAAFEARGEGLIPQDVTRIEGAELLRVAGCMLADPRLGATVVAGGEGIDNDFYGPDSYGDPPSADVSQQAVVKVTRQADLGELRLEFRPGRDADQSVDSRVEAIIQFSTQDMLMQAPLSAASLAQPRDLTSFNVVSATTMSGGTQSLLYEDRGTLLGASGGELTMPEAWAWGGATDDTIHRFADSADVAC